MAVEVAHHVYYFSEQSTGAGKTLDDYIQEREAYEKNRETNDTSKGVFYNYIHDLESVWWIVVWALFNFEKKDARTDSYTTLQRKLNKDKLFSGTTDSNYRFRFLSIRESYARTIRCLPKYFKNLSVILGIIAKAITELYRKKESNKEWNKVDPILWDESSNIHKIFIGLLDDVTTEQFEIVRVPGIDDKTDPIPGIDDGIVLIPGIYDGIIPATQSNKRRTDEQDSEQCNKRQRYCIHYFSHFVMIPF